MGGCPDRPALNDVLRAVAVPSPVILADMITATSCQLMLITGTHLDSVDVVNGARCLVREAE